MEFIGIRDISVNYGLVLSGANGMSNFVPFRIHPRLKDAAAYPPKFSGESLIHSHFFSPPAGSFVRDLPTVLEERMLRTPKDMREVLALGAVIDEQKCKFNIYAPELTGAPDVLLRVHRYPEWAGLGIALCRIDEDDENIWDLEFIAFSED